MATRRRPASKRSGRAPSGLPIGHPSNRPVREQPGGSLPPAQQGAGRPHASLQISAPGPTISLGPRPDSQPDSSGTSSSQSGPSSTPQGSSFHRLEEGDACLLKGRTPGRSSGHNRLRTVNLIMPKKILCSGEQVVYPVRAGGPNRKFRITGFPRGDAKESSFDADSDMSILTRRGSGSC